MAQIHAYSAASQMRDLAERAHQAPSEDYGDLIGLSNNLDEFNACMYHKRSSLKHRR